MACSNRLNNADRPRHCSISSARATPLIAFIWCCRFWLVSMRALSRRIGGRASLAFVGAPMWLSHLRLRAQSESENCSNRAYIEIYFSLLFYIRLVTFYRC